MKGIKFTTLNMMLKDYMLNWVHLKTGSKPPWTIPNKFCSFGLLCAAKRTVQRKKEIHQNYQQWDKKKNGLDKKTWSN